MAKFFDIDDANTALPELRTILETLRDERAQLIELRDEFARRAAVDATDAAEAGESGGEGSGSSGSAGLPGPRVVPVDEESPAAEERRRLRLRMQGVIDQMQAGPARLGDLRGPLRENETRLIYFSGVPTGPPGRLRWAPRGGGDRCWRQLAIGVRGRP